MRVVDPFGEGDEGPGVGVVVAVRELHCEFEYAIGVEAPAEEDDAVECAEVGLAG